MRIARSRITGQGQISVPAEVRRRLGLAAGSVLEWDVRGGEVVVRRAGRYTLEDIHRTLFPTPPRHLPIQAIDEGIRRQLRRKHARR